MGDIGYLNAERSSQTSTLQVIRSLSHSSGDHTSLAEATAVDVRRRHIVEMNRALIALFLSCSLLAISEWAEGSEAIPENLGAFRVCIRSQPIAMQKLVSAARTGSPSRSSSKNRSTR